jgi:hypothetical protein
MNLVKDTGWHKNLILNNGLDKLWSSSNFLNWFSIGTGTSAPSPTETTLQTPIAVSADTGVGNGINVAAIAPDWEYSQTKSKRFFAGNGVGLVTEVGGGYSATMGQNLFNRLLLPIPVNKGVDNVLDVILRLTIWPDLTDHDSTAVFKGITYDTITRVSVVGSYTGADAWSPFVIVDSGSITWTAYPGAIGDIENVPTGTRVNGGSGAGWSSETYVNGNYYRDIRYGAGLNDWVIGSGIRCLVGDLGLLNLQTQFTEATGQPNPGDAVPKDNTEIMDFAWRYTWGRRP